MGRRLSLVAESPDSNPVILSGIGDSGPDPKNPYGARGPARTKRKVKHSKGSFMLVNDSVMEGSQTNWFANRRSDELCIFLNHFPVSLIGAQVIAGERGSSDLRLLITQALVV